MNGRNEAIPQGVPTPREALEGLLNQPLTTPSLTVEQARHLLFLVRAQQVALSTWGPTGLKEAINASTDKTDVGWHTFLRLWMVFEYVLLNGLDNQGWKGDQERTDSTFNQATVGQIDIAVLSLVLPVIIALAIHRCEKKTRQTRQTVAHQIKKIQAISQDQSITEEDYLKTMQELLDNCKIVLPPEVTVAAETRPTTAAATQSKNKSVEDIKDIAEKKPVPQPAQEGAAAQTASQPTKKASSPIFKSIQKALSATWDFLAQSAIIFWPIWMTTVLIVGFGASYALPALPIVVAISFGLAALITGGVAAYRRRKEKKQAAVLADPAEPENKAKVEAIRAKLEAGLKRINAIMPRLLQRAHMKLVHRQFKEDTQGVYDQLFPKTIKKEQPAEQAEPAANAAAAPASPYAVHTIGKEGIIVLLDKEQDEQPTPPVQLPSQKEMREAIEASQSLGSRILGSRGDRFKFLAAFFTDSVIGQYTLSAFVCWILGSAVLSLGLLTGLTPALAGIAAAFSAVGMLFLGGIAPGVSAAFNVIMGLGFTGHGLKKIKEKREHLIATLYQQLKAPYRPKNQRWIEEIRADLKAREACENPIFEGITQEEAFMFFFNRVEGKKQDIAGDLKARQTLIKAKVKAGEVLTPNEKALLRINLKEINVFNDRYFKTQEVGPSKNRRLNRFLYKLYKGINGAQTGIFVTRSLFLTGAALAVACAAAGPFAPAVFIGIAATIGVIACAAKLFHLYLDKKERNRQFFADTLPDRISYLKKQYKQLMVAEAILHPHAANAANGGGDEKQQPTVQSQATANVLFCITQSNQQKKAAPAPEPGAKKPQNSRLFGGVISLFSGMGSNRKPLSQQATREDTRPLVANHN
jgi:hypothetical protein